MMTKLIRVVLTSGFLLGGTLYSTSQISGNEAKRDYTLEEAKEAALKEVNGKYIGYEVDLDDYEIIVEKDGYLYHVEVDKTTGKIDDVDSSIILKSQKNNIQETTISVNQDKITLKEAKEIALKQVDGKIIKEENDDDEFSLTIQKDKYIYEIEIDKKTGEIKEIDKEKTVSNKNISLEEAKTIALNKVNGTIVDVEIDDEYDFKIMKDNYLYEIEVDCQNGKITDFDKKIIRNEIKISKKEAESIALKEVNGKVTDIELDKEDSIYDIEIEKEKQEYEIEIDALTGKILKIEKDD